MMDQFHSGLSTYTAARASDRFRRRDDLADRDPGASGTGDDGRFDRARA